LELVKKDSIISLKKGKNLNKYKILIDTEKLESLNDDENIELIKKDSIISIKQLNLNKYKILVDPQNIS